MGFHQGLGRSIMLVRYQARFTVRSVVQCLACRRGRYVLGRDWVCFRLVPPPPNFLCLLRTPRVFLRTLKGSNHLEDKRREPPGKKPRAPEWILPGSAGSLPASPGEEGHEFLVKSGGGRHCGFEQNPNLWRKRGRPQTRRDGGTPTPPLSLPLGAGPVSTGTPLPAHLSRARRPLPAPRTVTATSPCSAAPSADSARAQLAGSRPTASGSARPPSPTVPGRRRRLRRRRQRRCSSRTRSALPRSPRSRSPAQGDGSSSLRAPAASSR